MARITKPRIYPINQHASIVGCPDIREWRVLNKATGTTSETAYRLFGDALRAARKVSESYYTEHASTR